MNSTELRKIQKLFFKSQELLDIDVDSSLFLSRKTLESIVHKYFEYADIEKKEEAQRFPELSKMIWKLKELKIIDNEIFNLMNYIRNKGNDGVHINDKTAEKKTIKPVNPSIAKGSIIRLGKVIVWFLEVTDQVVNTLYLNSASIGKIKSKEFSKDEEVHQLYNMISILCNEGIFKNPNRISEVACSINTSIIFDDELNMLIDDIDKFCKRYINFHNKYINQDNYKDQIKSFFGIKKASSTEAFKQIYMSEFATLKELRELVFARYAR